MPRSRSVPIALIVGWALAARLGAQHASAPSPVQRPVPPPVTTTATAATASADTTYRRMRWAVLVDSQVAASPVEVERLLTPADWTVDTHVKWGATKSCPSNFVTVTTRATSPDGVSGFEIFTPFAWEWFDDSATRQIQIRAQSTQAAVSPFCPVIQLVSPADYIRQAILRRFRPDAREIRADSMPKLAAATRSQMDTANAAMLATHRYTSVRADAARLEIAYEINGHPVEEWITATVEVVEFPLPSPRPRKIGEKTPGYMASAINVYAYRAPAGTLDTHATLFATMINSIRVNRQWVTARDWVLGRMVRPQISDPGDRASAMRAEAQHIAETAPEKRQLVAAPVHELGEFVLATHGLTGFADPVTRGRLDLDSACPRPLSNGTGDYLLSTNLNFDPTPVSGGPWMPLSPLPQ